MASGRIVERALELGQRRQVDLGRRRGLAKHPGENVREGEHEALVGIPPRLGTFSSSLPSLSRY